MRKSIPALLTLIILTVIISACSGNNNGGNTAGNNSSASPSNTAAADQAKDGGNLILGVQADPVVLNPIYAGDRVSLTIDQALYAPLFQVNNGKKTFYLADSLEPSADNLTYTLKLKSGLTWHDGQPLTADDVVFTFDTILDEKQNSFFRENLILNGKPIKAVKVDDTTVEFKLPQVNPAFEATLVQLTPIPKHIFEGEANIEKSTKNNAPVGSGAFKFKEYKTGEYVTLERFDNYFGGKPHLDSITYRIAKDANAANLALQNGEINVKYLDPQDVSTIESTGNFDIQAYSEGRLAYLLFNEDSDTGALKKKEVRQAISYALNRDELIQTVYGSSEYADPAKSFVTPDGLFQTNDVPSYDNDVNKAKELLASAGESNLKLRFIVSSGNKAQEAASLYIQQKLKAVGITVELQSMDASAYGQKFTDLKSKDYELSYAGYIMGYDPDAYRILYTTGSNSNYARYSNPEVDKLFDQGAGEADATKRGEAYQQLQKIIADDAVIYPVGYTKTIVAIDKRFGGLNEAVLKPVVIFEDPSKLYMK
ncbi:MULTISPECIES: ABC transporter substrate-binding protein [unclassified Paenibacillus]|uniref:ABC transporter substrate-binding protein n=1 Tax=unclassified Paenibacillus TaxID=185978 RepID=UPI001048D10C|nr:MULTISPECIES: ABC transporter substrate-binding protein [unclassified Paenibacillus]NIK69093.1 peptide/nickel transport system substrate-binding protein [Paenibacillus sp. BK720]TCM89096.1 peptide/nickel transport system substrate-binding protein [Paenibacillus sp. BK033]